MKKIWTSSTGKEFDSKADAFEWLNEVVFEVDNVSIFCCGEKRYTKNHFGIYDESFKTYLKGNLPVERYENI